MNFFTGTRGAAAIAALLAASLLAAGGSASAETAGAQVPSGYFEREGNEGELALVTGMSEFVRLYPGWRIARLYIPFPYAASVSPETVRRVFETVHATTTGSAYLRGDFGVLEEEAIAHLDTLKHVDEKLLFDCGRPAPCVVEISRDELVVVTPGVVKDKEVHYRLVPD